MPILDHAPRWSGQYINDQAANDMIIHDYLTKEHPAITSHPLDWPVHATRSQCEKFISDATVQHMMRECEEFFHVYGKQ